MNFLLPSVGSSTLLGLASATLATLTQAATVTIYPVKDNTIFSELGSNSNGGGDLYAGRTGVAGGIRRALVQFPILENVPAGAVIDSVSLSFTQTKIGPAGIATFELHRLNRAWGEGTALGTGAGATAGAGDATWNSASHGTTAWTTTGGDFAAASATTDFNLALATYTFSSSASLVADVQDWLNNPATNFGWLLRASDEVSITARQLGSRDSPANQRPSLVINFTPVPEPTTSGLLGIMFLSGCGLRRRKS